MSIKISRGIKDAGVVVGNSYDKYGSRNPLVRWMMRGFDESLSELVKQTAPKTIHEVGCGEGYWVLQWNKLGLAARGSDFSKKIIQLASENARLQGVSPGVFETRSIYDLLPGRDSADLVVCCEVLEHLEDPEAGLAVLERIATSYVVLSVPREPIWRGMNLARGKYVGQFGNTPGHLQHWSSSAFKNLVCRYFDVIEVRTPLPWTMLLASVRR